MLSLVQKTAYDRLIKRGIETRIAYVIINEGFLTFEDFCAARTTREMLRIPNFGSTSLRKVMTFAARNDVPIRDDRLPKAPRMQAGNHTKHPAFEYTVLDIDDRYSGGEIIDMLNSYGSEGWETSGMFRSMLIMKRLVRP